MRRPLCLLAVLFAVFTAISIYLVPPSPTVTEKAEGRYVTLLGTVGWIERAVSSSDGELYLNLTLEDFTVDSGIPEGIRIEVRRGDKALCRIRDNLDRQEDMARIGSLIRIRGKLKLFRRASNDGEYDPFLYNSCIQGYLFSLDEASVTAYTAEKNPVKSTMYGIRSFLSERIDAIYEGKGERGMTAASALKAILLGQTSLVDPALKERFQMSGIVHVLCISGLHISLIGSGIYMSLRKGRVPAPAACWISVALLYLYGVMTGMHTSCVRALVMFGLRMCARAVGRTYDMLTAMSIAMALMLIEQPCYLLHSGFLFSFAAVAAAALLIPVIPKAAKPLAIPLFTLPVQLLFFYTFPLYSVLLNVIVIFLAPGIIVSGGLSLLLGVIAGMLPTGLWLSAVSQTGAGIVGELPVLILLFYEKLCTLTEKLPLSTLTPGRPPALVIAVYFALIGTVVLDRNLREIPNKKRSAVHFACMAVAVTLLLGLRYEPPFALYMLDVGQGDGICVRTRDEKGKCTVLIDGGSSSKNSVGENIEIPFLRCHGISGIDYCILTHDDLDHCSGLLELLEQSDEPGGIRIQNIALPSVLQERKGETYLKIEEICDRKGIPISYLYRGMTFTDGELILQCIHPAKNASYEDANEYSVALQLTYGNFGAILTGDLENRGEADLLAYLGDREIHVDILKAAHHGSAGGTTQAFLDRIFADAALISCGKGNRYGHPAAETVERLEEAGMRIYDTRKDGQICVTTDGRRGYSVQTFY